MKLIFKVALPAILFTILLGSCKKYEEGPAFSLRTKKARLTGEWTLDRYLYNGADSTASFREDNGANYVMEIEKDGTYKVVGADPETGTWKLGEDKDDLYTTSNAAGSQEWAWRIILLKNKELGLKHTFSNGDVIKLYLKQ